MPWNGSGVFSRLFSWVADKNAGIDISSSRMDSDTNDIVTNGLGNALTRDGQGSATANQPMNNFRHTGVGNGVARNDYAALGQIQDGVINWAIAGGTADALTVTLAPVVTALVDGQLIHVRASAANATTTPTLAVDGIAAHVITKLGGQALATGDIPGALAECIFRYDLANTRFELLNPSPSAAAGAIFSTGDVKLTFKTAADAGWVMMDDGTIGNSTSGATTLASTAQAAALFALIWNNITNTWCAIQDSTGTPTTRGASAAADFAASKRMPLPKSLGRALAIAGSGSGLTARALGQNLGEETHTLALGEAPTGQFTFNDTTHAHTFNDSVQGNPTTSVRVIDNLTGGSFAGSGTAIAKTISINTSTTGASITDHAGGGAHNNMQPSGFINIMIKL